MASLFLYFFIVLCLSFNSGIRARYEVHGFPRRTQYMSGSLVVFRISCDELAHINVMPEVT